MLEPLVPRDEISIFYFYILKISENARENALNFCYFAKLRVVEFNFVCRVQ